ncbi:MAG: DUF3253 domain-containing protein [Comamonadaceae bacterium]|nr:MAG: DUF3253 domain-containing protein [Comamonadaceae bacterium]
MTIEKTILELLDAGAPGASIRPSDVARSLAADEKAWRALMDPVRQVAAGLVARGLVRITQGATEVDLSQPVKGPVRIRRGPAWPK